MLKLISIVPSKDDKHKYVARFNDGKNIKFGAKGYSDYTKHKNEDRKKRYLKRHNKNENWNDPQTKGSLSKYILWNKTSLKDSIQDYKNKFKL